MRLTTPSIIPSASASTRHSTRTKVLYKVKIITRYVKPMSGSRPLKIDLRNQFGAALS